MEESFINGIVDIYDGEVKNKEGAVIFRVKSKIDGYRKNYEDLDVVVRDKLLTSRWVDIINEIVYLFYSNPENFGTGDDEVTIGYPALFGTVFTIEIVGGNVESDRDFNALQAEFVRAFTASLRWYILNIYKNKDGIDRLWKLVDNIDFSINTMDIEKECAGDFKSLRMIKYCTLAANNKFGYSCVAESR